MRIPREIDRIAKYTIGGRREKRRQGDRETGGREEGEENLRGRVAMAPFL
jgi:hypothetical protein